MMVLWNKVSPVSPSLNDVQSGVGKGPVRVWSVRSVDLLQILAVGMLIKGRSWLAFDAAISTSSFGLFYRKVRKFQHSVLMVKDCNCKPVFLG